VTGQPFSADFVDFKTYQTRSVIRLFFESPIEDADEILKRLGGVPTAAKSRACAIVLLNPEPEEPKAAPEPASSKPAGAEPERTPWHKLSFTKQAGILCKEPGFQKWLRVDDEEAAADMVRRICGCASRRDLDRNPDAAAIWIKLSDSYRSLRDRESQEASLMRRAP
jgi:hypothetical protein